MDTEILHKYLSGTCTEQQRREVENWLQESLENQEKMNELKQVWEVSPGKKIHVDSHQAWDTFSDRHMYNSKKSGNTAFKQE
ncbi:MAG: hypothetical protein U5K69_23325 [Balneolaceae bacterium]|nr:hypothetical protein [Balneolaceae bacterium]